MSFTPIPSAKSNKSRWIIAALLAIVLGGGVVSFLSSGTKAHRTAAKKPDVISITLPPPPPPPPPPTPPPPKSEPPPPEEEEMVMQEPVVDDEPMPDEAPPESPPADLATGITGGNGPDMGLTTRGNGSRIGGPTQRGGGSKFGWYAAKVQSSIAEALRRHPSTRNATMSLMIRIWPDSSGRITRAQLVGTSGNAAVDQAIKSRILAGLQLPQAPPADMPTPIVLRINARRSVQ